MRFLRVNKGSADARPENTRRVRAAHRQSQTPSRRRSRERTGPFRNQGETDQVARPKAHELPLRATPR